MVILFTVLYLIASCVTGLFLGMAIFEKENKTDHIMSVCISMVVVVIFYSLAHLAAWN